MDLVVIARDVCILSYSWELKLASFWSQSQTLFSLWLNIDSGTVKRFAPESTSISMGTELIVCKLQPSTVSLYQYCKSPLKVSGECQADV